MHRHSPSQVRSAERVVAQRVIRRLILKLDLINPAQAARSTPLPQKYEMNLLVSSKHAAEVCWTFELVSDLHVYSVASATSAAGAIITVSTCNQRGDPAGTPCKESSSLRAPLFESRESLFQGIVRKIKTHVAKAKSARPRADRFFLSSLRLRRSAADCPSPRPAGSRP